MEIGGLRSKHQVNNSEFALFYLLQLGNWFSTFLYLGVEKKRSDFIAMLIHHTVTCSSVHHLWQNNDAVKVISIFLIFIIIKILPNLPYCVELFLLLLLLLGIIWTLLKISKIENTSLFCRMRYSSASNPEFGSAGC